MSFNKSITGKLQFKSIMLFSIVVILTYSCSVGFTQMDAVYKSYVTAKSYITKKKNITKKISGKKQTENEMVIIFLLVIIGSLSILIISKGR